MQQTFRFYFPTLSFPLLLPYQCNSNDQISTKKCSNVIYLIFWCYIAAAQMNDRD
eukprot:UN25954